MIPPIIILGMHRSGTSLLAGCLEAAGLFLGTVNNAAPFNRKGNKEYGPVVKLHDSILARHGFDWKNPPKRPLSWAPSEKQRLIDALEPFSEIKQPWGVKDPRTIWLIDAWLEVFPDAALVGVFRHPLRVASSLAARSGDLAVSIDHGLNLWRETNLRILELYRERNFLLLHYADGDTIQSQFFDPLLKFAKQAGLTGDPFAFYDSTLNHQSHSFCEVPAESLSLYEALLQASSNARKLIR